MTKGNCNENSQQDCSEYCNEVDLKEKLKVQIRRLECGLKEDYEPLGVLNISVAVRVLVRDNGRNSCSLLKQLGLKELPFIDSSSDNRMHSMTGIKGAMPSNTKNQHFGLISKINNEDVIKAFPLFKQHRKESYEGYNEVDFNTWWEKSKVIRINDKTFSRKYLILNLVDKDGGAHVDKKLPKDYSNIKKSKVTLNINGKEVELGEDVIFASVYQIGWELLNSIKKYQG